MSLEQVPYTHSGTALTGRLARPARDPRAAIVLFPTIANFNAPAERRAKLLADAGYLVLVADFYGVAEGDWESLAKELRADVAHYRARLAAAVATLRGLPFLRGMPRRWRRSHRHLRLTPSFCASSVSLIESWCSSTKRWK